MKNNIGVIVGLALMMFASNTDALGEGRPDFSKPEVLQKILEEAVAFEHLDLRRSGGGVTAYHGPG
jgi:hypothetical protein